MHLLSKAEVRGFSELFEKIETQEARDAFFLLVNSFCALDGFQSVPGDHGFIKDFRVVRDGKNLFAFIANQNWLLVYFRRPALSAKIFSSMEIIETFPQAEETNAKEWKLRVQNYEDALKVVKFALQRLE